MQHAYLVDGVIVDLYFYYSGIEEGFLVNCTDACVLRIPVEYSEEIPASHTWSGLSLPVPPRVEDYLAWTYGDWEVPRQGKSFWVEDRPNLRPVIHSENWQLPGFHSTLAEYLDRARSQVPHLATDSVGGQDTIMANSEVVQRLKRVLAQRDRAFLERDEAIAQLNALRT
jgi:hypothetical protein